MTINQSHGGSTKQALAVANGLEADVVTFNQAPDVDVLVKTGGIVSADWRKKFPNGAAPYTTTSVFLVRKGNPKGIKDWEDLAKPGIEVIVPNPKTSGNGRYTYLAAWGYALRKTGNEDGRQGVRRQAVRKRAGARRRRARRYHDVHPARQGRRARHLRERGGADRQGVRGRQVRRRLSEGEHHRRAAGRRRRQVVDKRGSRKLAEAYLNFLYSPEGQAIIAKHDLRPRDEAVLKANAAKFPAIETFSVEELLGGWEAVQKHHFADGATYDQIAIKQ